MTGWVRQILERYGQKVTVQTGETTVDVRAFLQPVPERSERAREEATHTQADIHELDTGYLAACRESALQAAQALGWNGWTFRVRSCRPYYVGDRLSHYWAVLEREREAAGCGS